MKAYIDSLYIGEEKSFLRREKEYKSSYKKELVKSAYVTKTGFKGDNQSDKEAHGGESKAVCIYPKSYYEYFKTKYNITLPSCALGENITLFGFDDSMVNIGDRFKCGEVVFEVSQPRQPCWKISSILGIKELTALIVKEFKSGFYLRVIKEGEIEVGDSFELIKRVHENISIESINRYSYDAKNHQDDIKRVLDCKELSPEYANSLKKRLKDRSFGIESWQED